MPREEQHTAAGGQKLPRPSPPARLGQDSGTIAATDRDTGAWGDAKARWTRGSLSAMKERPFGPHLNNGQSLFEPATTHNWKNYGHRLAG